MVIFDGYFICTKISEPGLTTLRQKGAHFYMQSLNFGNCSLQQKTNYARNLKLFL